MIIIINRKEGGGPEEGKEGRKEGTEGRKRKKEETEKKKKRKKRGTEEKRGMCGQAGNGMRQEGGFLVFDMPLCEWPCGTCGVCVCGVCVVRHGSGCGQPTDIT